MKPNRNPSTPIQTRPAFRVCGARNRSVFRSLALAASLACLVPISLSAKDKGQEQDKHEKKEGKGNSQKHGNRNASARIGSQPAAQQAFRSGSRGSIAQQIPNPVQFAQPQGTRENRYGGQWFPGNTHSDWEQGGEHYWNHRHYRWYDGGWLIITAGYEQGYEQRYAPRNSVARSVQRKLAAQGYYNGAIDGDIGPGSRRAIMNYQDDYGLRATGRISDSLLVSLGLE